MEDLFDRLSKSAFRSKFKLKKPDIEYIQKKGLTVIEQHAGDFVKKRLSPAVIPNDGKQTPMRGHPVFPAQHATACCCRVCLKKWHGYEAGVELTEEQQAHIVAVLMEWIRRQLEEQGISLEEIQDGQNVYADSGENHIKEPEKEEEYRQLDLFSLGL